MSSTPTPYTRKANFVSYEGGSPNNPKRGTDLDAEFDAIKTAADTTQSRLAEIQRGDGKLANDTVHIDAIPAATRTVLSADAAAAGAAAATAAATPLVAQATAQASLATTQATAAASSATAANNSKNAAAASATAASTSATAASTSATAASTSATNAATSKTGADTAKTDAQAARDAAAVSAAAAVQATAYTDTGAGATMRTLHEKLADHVFAADFGVLPAVSTDQTVKAQAAMDALQSRGGGFVHFPEGTFRLKNLKMRTGVILRGAGKYATVLKIPNGVDGSIFYNPGQDTPGITVDFAGIEDMTIDGNIAGAANVTAASAGSLSGFKSFHARNVVFQNASGYGLALQGRGGGTQPGPQSDVYLENCDILNNGAGVDGGATTFDGIDIKDCDRVTIVGGKCVGNTDDGYDIRGHSVTLVGCYSADNGNVGFSVGANNATPPNSTTIRHIGCEARNNGTSGFAYDSGSGVEPLSASMTGCVSADNDVYGVQIPTNGSSVRLSISDSHIFQNGSHGIVASTAYSLSISNSVVRDNLGSGIATSTADVRVVNTALRTNSRYGLENTSAGGTRSVIGSGCDLRGNTLGTVLFGSNRRSQIAVDARFGDVGVDDILPSAATLALPVGGRYFVVSGTTGITQIDGGFRGRTVTLHFTGALTVTNGGALALDGDFTSANGSTLTLVSNGTTWYEVARTTKAPRTGVYTPTLFNTTNIAASNAYLCQWMRVDDMVTVSGKVDIDPTAGSVTSLLGMSLPIPSNFAAVQNLGGTAVCTPVASLCAGITGDLTNDRASFTWVHTADTSNRGWTFSFTYRVMP